MRWPKPYFSATFFFGGTIKKKVAQKFIFLSSIYEFSTQHNVWQLQEDGDFEALNCLPPLNLIRSTKLHLTTEPPISCRCLLCPVLLVHFVGVSISYWINFLIASGSKLIRRLFVSKGGTAPVV